MQTKMRYTLKLDSQAVTAYQTCPASFNFAHVMDLVPRKKKKSLQMGTVFHDAFEHYNKGLIRGESLSTLTGEIVDNLMALKSFTLEERMFIVKRFLEYFKTFPTEQEPYNVISAEEGFSKVLYEDEYILFIYEGRMDVLLHHLNSDAIVWRDYKTTSGNYYLYQHTNQFLGYTWALSGQNKKVWGEIEYIGKQKKFTDKTFQRKMVSFTSDQLERWRLRTIDTYRKILGEQVNGPSENSMSQYKENLAACQGPYGVCPYHEFCERPRELRNHVAMVYFNKRDNKWSAWKEREEEVEDDT